MIKRVYILGSVYVDLSGGLSGSVIVVSVDLITGSNTFICKLPIIRLEGNSPSSAAYYCGYGAASMLNIGTVEGMDAEMAGKSAFMELQQQGMGPGMGHPAYGHIPRSSYQTHHHPQHDGLYASTQGTRGLGYPFPMNTMPPSTYSPAPTHHFQMPQYHSPSPTRDGKCHLSYVYH